MWYLRRETNQQFSFVLRSTRVSYVNRVAMFFFIIFLQSSIPLWLLYSSLGRITLLPDVVFSDGFSRGRLV